MGSHLHSLDGRYCGGGRCSSGSFGDSGQSLLSLPSGVLQ